MQGVKWGPKAGFGKKIRRLWIWTLGGLCSQSIEILDAVSSLLTHQPGRVLSLLASFPKLPTPCLQSSNIETLATASDLGETHTMQLPEQYTIYSGSCPQKATSPADLVQGAEGKLNLSTRRLFRRHILYAMWPCFIEMIQTPHSPQPQPQLCAVEIQLLQGW